MSWLTLQGGLIRHHLLDQGETILAAGDHVVVTKSWQKDLRPRSIFLVSLWQSRTGSVLSEFIPDPCQAPHVFSALIDQVEKAPVAQTPPKKTATGHAGVQKAAKIATAGR